VRAHTVAGLVQPNEASSVEAGELRLRCGFEKGRCGVGVQLGKMRARNETNVVGSPNGVDAMHQGYSAP
jgi:hypothetical protein